MALTVTYSLFASLIIAMTLVPSMASMMFVKEPKPEGRGFAGFKRGYRRLLAWNLRHKALVLILVLVLFGYSVYGTLQKLSLIHIYWKKWELCLIRQDTVIPFPAN